MPGHLITLLTDFGTHDGFVGAVKAVLATLAPELAVDDVAHVGHRGNLVVACGIDSDDSWGRLGHPHPHDLAAPDPLISREDLGRLVPVPRRQVYPAVALDRQP